MKTGYLFPRRFKSIGFIAFVSGLTLWIMVQRDLLDPLFSNFSNPHFIKVITLTLSFIGFLFGYYTSMFSREKIEDEYIQSLRLNSFQFGVLLQVLFLVATFLFIAIIPGAEPGNAEAFILIFITALVIQWLSTVLHFNIRLILSKQTSNEE